MCTSQQIHDITLPSFWAILDLDLDDDDSHAAGGRQAQFQKLQYARKQASKHGWPISSSIKEIHVHEKLSGNRPRMSVTSWKGVNEQLVSLLMILETLVVFK
jgi:hypothetical protein